jgi:hypothetical protein
MNFKYYPCEKCRYYKRIGYSSYCKNFKEFTRTDGTCSEFKRVIL